MAVSLPAALQPHGNGRVVSGRLALGDGARTTVYVAVHPVATTELRVSVLRRPRPLVAWCMARGVQEAIVGGFFVRPDGTPLGELRTRGVARRHEPFTEPWDGVRACLHVQAGTARIARRSELDAQPRGDLLQAGPLLVRDGAPCFERAADAEGFAAASHQFDSDITDGRHPRAALGLAPGHLVAVACDGRAGDDAGLALEELARLLADIGCHTALNLDGGGSTSLISGGRLQNQPRAGVERPVPGGGAVSTALVFLPR